MLQKKDRYLYHILLLTILFVMDFFGDYVYNGMEGLMQNFTFPGNVFLINFYIVFVLIYAFNFYVVCPRFIPINKFKTFLLATVGTFVLYAGLRFFLDEVVAFNLFGRHNYFIESLNPFYYIFDNTYHALKVVLYSTSLFLLFRFIDNKERLHALELEHKKAELSLLKGQIEPHFLFNTLNAFYTDLVDTQPETAKDVHTLSELLRYVTYEAKSDYMPIEKELHFIDNYLALYRKRYEDSFSFDYTVEGVIGQEKIPSLVLIHFVENVFKHGIVTDASDPAMVLLTITGSELQVKTENRINPSEKYSAEGIGSGNLRKRLTALFDDGFTLEEKELEGRYFVDLVMPIVAKSN